MYDWPVHCLNAEGLAERESDRREAVCPGVERAGRRERGRDEERGRHGDHAEDCCAVFESTIRTFAKEVNRESDSS